MSNQISGISFKGCATLRRSRTGFSLAAEPLGRWHSLGIRKINRVRLVLREFRKAQRSSDSDMVIQQCSDTLRNQGGFGKYGSSRTLWEAFPLAVIKASMLQHFRVRYLKSCLVSARRQVLCICIC